MAKTAGVANLGLSVLAGLVVLSASLRGSAGTPSGGVMDIAVFSLIWAYVLLTPLLAAWAIFAAGREGHRTLVRVNVGLLVVWVGCITYFATLTM
jgi:hypothetical protein